MLGHVEEWFYSGLLGIQPDPEAPGFKHFIIHPQVVGDLAWAKGHYHSVRGRIVSEWKMEHGRLSSLVRIPANTTATIYLPGRDPAKIMEGNRPAGTAKGIRFLGTQGSTCVFRLGSGTYRFVSP